MALWIGATLAAASLQTVRFMLQKQLRATALSTMGASAVRFVYAAPLAALVAFALTRAEGWPVPGPGFWAFALGGGLGQILGTLLTVALFARRNFAVGVAFTKTETLQVAVFSALILGEHVSALGLVAILVGVAGILLMSRPAEGPMDLKGMAMGVVAGAGFGASAIGYRGAALALSHGDAVMRAAVTLACVTAFQAVVMLSLMLIRGEAAEIARMARAWRVAGLVGLSGMLASLGWFTAFALQNAAYVRALGQVEMLFTLTASRLIFHERLSGRELSGIGLVVASLVLLILSL